MDRQGVEILFDLNGNGQHIISMAPRKTSFANDLTYDRGSALKSTIRIRDESARRLLQESLQASFNQFELQLPGYVTHRGFLMRDQANIKSILSASNIPSFTLVRPELRLQDCVFNEITTQVLMDKLSDLKSLLTRQQINECRLQLWQDFTDSIPSQIIQESDVSSFLESFVKSGLSTLRARFPCIKSATIPQGRIAGARGILARRGPEGEIDENAGYYGRTDRLVKFGHPDHENRTLLVAEFKFHLSRPSNDVWFTQSNCQLAQLMVSLVGHFSMFGLAMSNYGLKVLMMEPPQDPEGMTEFSIWPPGLQNLDYHASPEDAFEFFLEVLRLSANRRTDTQVPKPRADRDQINQGVVEAEIEQPLKRIRCMTKGGEMIVMRRIDMESELNKEEIDLIYAQIEEERRIRLLHELEISYGA